MPAPVDLYAIFDVAFYNFGIIRFLRYQSEPQGDRIYGNNTGSYVHEICGQKNANKPAYEIGGNYYNEFSRGEVYHDKVANILNPLSPNSYDTNSVLSPNLLNEDRPAYNIRNEQFFTVRLVGTPMGNRKRDRLNNEGVNINKTDNWKGDYFLYENRGIELSWNYDGAENYINFEGRREIGRNPHHHGFALIDVIVRIIDGSQEGFPNRFCYSFNNPYYAHGARINPEWTPKIERWKLIEMVTPFVRIQTG
jgi:hypothetical protein